MPRGTRQVNAYKAYTQASRHRQATYLVTSDGAERQEILGRRPLGDLRVIREADVWANMGRNLSRAPEKESALAFLERAREVRQSATRSLQESLQPGEQRQVEGLQKTTLRQSFRQHRVEQQMDGVAQQCAEAVQRQDRVFRQMQAIGPALRQAVNQALAVVRPLLRELAGRIRQQQETARQHRKLEAIRKRLLQERVVGWRLSQEKASTVPEAEPAARKRLRLEIAAMPDAELHRVAGGWRQQEQEQKAPKLRQQRDQAPPRMRSRGPSMGM